MHFSIETAQREVLSTEWLPVPNPMLYELIGLLNDPESQTKDFVDLINKDSSLMSQVLKVANSAYYGMRGRVDDLNRALIIIGLEEVKNILITLVLFHNFKGSNIPKAFDYARFWQHALLVASLSRDLSSMAKNISQRQYYTAGLLHDLGRLIMANQFPGLFNQIIKGIEHDTHGLFQRELELGLTHTQVGFWLGKKWNLPPWICQSIYWHHQPDGAKSFRREVILVHIADEIAKWVQERSDENPLPPDPGHLESIGLLLEEHMELCRAAFDLKETVEGLYKAISHNG